MTLQSTAQKVRDKTMPLCTMVVAAAGSSTRMGGVDKLFALVGGIPVNTHTRNISNVQSAEKNSHGVYYLTQGP